MRAGAGLRWVAVLLAALLLAVAAPAVEPTPHDHATSLRRFDDVAYWSQVFDDPRRDAWQKPRELVAALRLAEGARVADLGAGTGYLSRYLSTAVGPGGAVLAIETEPNLIAHLLGRAEREGLANLTPILASRDTPRLPPASVDVILIVDTYHHLDKRRAYLPLLTRALRSGGRVAIVDWKPGKLPEGPEPDHKLPPEQVIAEMQAAGFTLAAQPDLLPFHYFLIFATETPRHGG